MANYLLSPCPLLRFLVTAVVLASLPTGVSAQADINNGTIRLGVRADGALIVPAVNLPLNSAGGLNLVGIRFMPTNYEATAGGLPIDGWGVADVISNQWGGGVFVPGSTNLTAITQTSTASTAVSTVTAAGIFQVTHDFHPSTHANAYEIIVTVKNISTATVSARYRRVIDWDLEPAINNEFVTIQGATLPGVLSFTNGAVFSPMNPLLPPSGVSGDVVNQGPGDMGATITFDLGMVAPGASVSFKHYYGAAASRAAAVAAATALGLQGYTLASPNTSPPTIGTPNTYFFGFFPSPAAAPPAGPAPEGSHVGSHGPPAATNPIGNAEGTFGFGVLLGPFIDVSALGMRHARLRPGREDLPPPGTELLVLNGSHRGKNRQAPGAHEQASLAIWSLGIAAFSLILVCVRRALGR